MDEYREKYNKSDNLELDRQSIISKKDQIPELKNSMSEIKRTNRVRIDSAIDDDSNEMNGLNRLNSKANLFSGTRNSFFSRNGSIFPRSGTFSRNSIFQRNSLFNNYNPVKKLKGIVYTIIFF